MMNTDRIMRLPEVLAKIGISRSTLYRAVSGGEFPKPIRLGRRAIGWNQPAVDAWLASRVAASRHAA